MKRNRFGILKSSYGRRRGNKFGASGVAIGMVVLMVIVLIGLIVYYVTSTSTVVVPTESTTFTSPPPPVSPANLPNLDPELASSPVVVKALEQQIENNSNGGGTVIVTPEDLGGSSANEEDVEIATIVNNEVQQAAGSLTPSTETTTVVSPGPAQLNFGSTGEGSSIGSIISGGQCGDPSSPPWLKFGMRKAGQDYDTSYMKVDLPGMCWQGSAGPMGLQGAQGDPGIPDPTGVVQMLKGKDLDINSLQVGDTQFRDGSRVHYKGKAYSKYGDEPDDDNLGKIGMNLFDTPGLSIVGNKDRNIKLWDNVTSGTSKTLGQSIIDGLLTVAGKITGNNQLYIKNNAVLDGTIQVAKTSRLKGAITADSTLRVKGNSTMDKALTVQNNIDSMKGTINAKEGNLWGDVITARDGMDVGGSRVGGTAKAKTDGGLIVTSGSINAKDGNLWGNNVNARNDVLADGTINAQGNLWGKNVNARDDVLADGTINAQGNLWGKNVNARDNVLADGAIKSTGGSLEGYRIYSRDGRFKKGAIGSSSLPNSYIYLDTTGAYDLRPGWSTKNFDLQG